MGRNPYLGGPHNAYYDNLFGGPWGGGGLLSDLLRGCRDTKDRFDPGMEQAQKHINLGTGTFFCSKQRTASCYGRDQEVLPHVVPVGAEVRINSAAELPSLHGKAGTVQRWEPADGHYVVDIDGRVSTSSLVNLLPACLTQLCRVEVRAADPWRKKLQGKICGLDRKAEGGVQYLVALDREAGGSDGEATVMLRPENAVLEPYTRVLLQDSVAEPELRGQMAQIVSFDRLRCCYAILCQDGKRAKVALGDVLC